MKLNLERNRISVIGNTFADYNNANILMSGNPLLCETLDNIPNLIPASNKFQFNGTCGNDTDGDGVPDDLDAFLRRSGSVHRQRSRRRSR